MEKFFFFYFLFVEKNKFLFYKLSLKKGKKGLQHLFPILLKLIVRVDIVRLCLPEFRIFILSFVYGTSIVIPSGMHKDI